MIETIYSNPDFLEHHGILGMKWGVRRYQNKDGSRIGTNSKSKSEDASLETNEKRIEKSIKDKYYFGDKGEKMDEVAEKTSALAEDIYKEYTNLHKSLQKNDDFRNDVYSTMNDKHQINDEFDFDLYLNETLWDKIPEYETKSIKDKRNKFDNYQTEFWNYRQEISNDVLKEVGDIKIKDKYSSDKTFSGEKAVNSVMAKFNRDDAQWMHYMNNHLDDYWIHDTDAFYKLEESFSYQDYLKRKSK